MPFMLKILYTVFFLGTLGITAFGFDSLYPVRKQIWFLLTGKATGLTATEGLFVFLGGIGLLFMVIAGFFADKRYFSKKNPSK